MDEFLGGRPLDTIGRALIDKITDRKLAQGLSNATVNRTLEVLRAILRKCVNEWEWLEMVGRYAHLAAEHLQPFADRLCALRAVEVKGDGTNMAQA